MSSKAEPAGRWIAYHTDKPDARLRLFCLPYAGSGAMVYRQWNAIAPPSIDVMAVQPPGREGRMSEPRFTRLTEIARAAVDALLPVLDEPFCFFGHSMGALIAFEMTRELRRRGGPQPLHLFVSGRRAPSLGVQYPLHHLPEPRLLAELERLDGSRPEVLRNRELMQIMLPIIRADLEACDTYVVDSEGPISVPITAFGGRDDFMAPPDGIAAWANETTSTFHSESFPGGHFFLNTARDQLLEKLWGELQRVLRSAESRTHD